MAKHLCHAWGCKTPVPRAMFMCRKHWTALPSFMRFDVLEEYRPGQENNPSRVTDEYIAATQRAIAWLREHEES
jgi:hypothetical protein